MFLRFHPKYFFKKGTYFSLNISCNQAEFLTLCTKRIHEEPPKSLKSYPEFPKKNSGKLF